MRPQLWEEAEAVLDAEVRPALSAHVGSIDITEVDGATVHLRFRASCRGCYFRRGCAEHLVRPVLQAHLGEGVELHVR